MILAEQYFVECVNTEYNFVLLQQPKLNFVSVKESKPRVNHEALKASKKDKEKKLSGNKLVKK